MATHAQVGTRLCRLGTIVTMRPSRPSGRSLMERAGWSGCGSASAADAAAADAVGEGGMAAGGPKLAAGAASHLRTVRSAARSCWCGWQASSGAEREPSFAGGCTQGFCS